MDFVVAINNEREMSMNIIKIKKIECEKLGVKTRIYVWLKNENMLENMANRFSRPYDVYKQEVLPKLELPAGAKVRWSQKAGCSCGCSPGFVVDAVLGYDIHVDVA
jgi:hypothetical protein